MPLSLRPLNSGAMNSGPLATLEDPFMSTAFYVGHDNVSAVTTGYTQGGSSLRLASGSGAAFGTSFPFLVSTFLSTGSPCGVYSVSGRSGDTLTGTTLVSGTDASLPAGSTVAMRMTAEHLTQIASAVNALEAAVPGKLTATANLSDLLSASAARTNLGLGTSATHPDTDFEQPANKGAANGYASLDGSGKVPLAQIPDSTGTGTVTTVSASVPTGFSVAVSNPTTTPAIAIITTLSGILKGTGSGVAVATAGTDYAPASNPLFSGDYAYFCTGGSGIIPIAIAGDFISGYAGIWVGNALSPPTGVNYSFISSATGQTAFNCGLGQSLELRCNNETVLLVTDSGTPTVPRVTIGYLVGASDGDTNSALSISPFNTSYKAISIKAQSGQTQNLQLWSNFAGTTVSAIGPNTAFRPPTLSDVNAADGDLYFGSDHLDTDSSPKLCRKNSAGNVIVIG